MRKPPDKLQTVGYRRVLTPAIECFGLFEKTGREEPLRVRTGARVLVLGARTRRTSRLIRTLRRGDACYVKYGSSLDHLATALGTFDHYLFGSSLRIDDEEVTRKLVRRTSLDVRSLLSIGRGEFVHWSASHRQAPFRPLTRRYIATLALEFFERMFRQRRLK